MNMPSNTTSKREANLLSKERTYDIKDSGRSVERNLHASLTDRQTLSSHRFMHQHPKVATMQENTTILAMFGVGC